MSKSFENLEVWKVSCRLAVDVLKTMDGCKIFGLRDQMVRSSLSIPSNIAEGSERRTSKDFRHFLHIALGSAAEMRTQTYIASEAGIISKETAEQWTKEVKSISKMHQGLITSLNRKP